MKQRLIEKLAHLTHSSWKQEKLERGHPIEHIVDGKPLDLRKHWHEIEEHHRAFDRKIAERMLERMLTIRFWFG